MNIHRGIVKHEHTWQILLSYIFTRYSYDETIHTVWASSRGTWIWNIWCLSFFWLWL